MPAVLCAGRVAAQGGSREGRGRDDGKQSVASPPEMAAYWATRPRIPVPPHWGGWRIRPQTVEFWQRPPNRMHDRLVCDRSGGEWRIKRLAP